MNCNRDSNGWGAHAPRVLIGAPSRRRTSLVSQHPAQLIPQGKVHFGEAPKSAREARALPG